MKPHRSVDFFTLEIVPRAPGLLLPGALALRRSGQEYFLALFKLGERPSSLTNTGYCGKQLFWFVDRVSHVRHSSPRPSFGRK